MQNKYVGDIGDYGKYGLLRDLFSSDHKLGIIWYLVPDERHVNDGRYIDYLSKNRFQDCDSELFLILKSIVFGGRRDITAIKQLKIFPAQTVFYSEILTYSNIRGNTPTGRQKRLELREQWLRGALETATNCDAIFLDPDNGLEKDTTDDVKQSSWFGVFVGTQVNLCKNMSLNVEYQHTAFANAVGANVVWRY
jgi:hypothetical protein